MQQQVLEGVLTVKTSMFSASMVVREFDNIDSILMSLMINKVLDFNSVMEQLHRRKAACI